MAGSGDSLTYRAAGVDLDAAERTKRAFAGLLDATGDAHTLSGLGAFGGLYSVPDTLDRPVLAASADGVGTKLRIAFLSGRHDTIGQDLVNHCVNDILVQGARPLFFLDYLAAGRLDEGIATAVVGGVAKACRANGCALLGGETAEMPDLYAEGEYDLAGFVVGVVERDRIVDGRRIRPGDRLIGLRSSGLHTNGYTLARAIVFDRMGLGVNDPFPGEGGATVADAMMRIHRSFQNTIAPLLERDLVRGMAHVTGGGIEGNLPRTLPAGTGARIDCAAWRPPNLFRQLARAGNVAAPEMYRVFNMGVGMILVVAPADEDAVLEAVGDEGWPLGEVVAGEGVELVGIEAAMSGSGG